MPIYEYACTACGHQLEAFQGINDPLLTECPKCHQAALQKLISAAGFRLKGGGWYETDFKGKDDKKKNLAGDVDQPKTPELTKAEPSKNSSSSSSSVSDNSSSSKTE